MPTPEALADTLRALLAIEADAEPQELLQAHLLDTLLSGGYLCDLALADRLERSGWHPLAIIAEDDATTEPSELPAEPLLDCWHKEATPPRAAGWGATGPEEDN